MCWCVYESGSVRKRLYFYVNNFLDQVNMKSQQLLVKVKVQQNGERIIQKMMLNGLFIMLKIYLGLVNILYHPNQVHHALDLVNLHLKVMSIGLFIMHLKNQVLVNMSQNQLHQELVLHFLNLHQKVRLIKYKRGHKNYLDLVIIARKIYAQ